MTWRQVGPGGIAVRSGLVDVDDVAKEISERSKFLADPSAWELLRERRKIQGVIIG